MGAELLGREEELSRLDGFLDRIGEGSALLLLEGEAGIGKTTLWRRGLQLARARGLHLLSCQPAPTETRLAFAGLSDLLGEETSTILPLLPPPQRRALEVSLLLAEGGEARPDPRAASLATLSFLRQVAAGGPFLLALDDVQWLDASSARVLAFALRRVERERIGLLLARRLEEGTEPELPLGLQHAPALLERLERRRVGPLSLGAIQSLLTARLELRLPRQLLVSLYEASGGNPFYALELARAQRGREPLSPGAPLRVPESLRALVQRRLAALPEGTQRSLLLAATLSEPTTELLEQAGEADLGEALEASVVELEGPHVHFTHPLHAAIVYGRASSQERRAAHAQAAALVESREERARHLALASERPDERVAQELELAANGAAARAAPDAAAELSELSARLTPPELEGQLRRRQLATAEHLYATGETARCRTLLESLIEALEPGPERVDALVLLAEIVELDGALSLCRQAAAEAGDDDVRAARALVALGAALGRVDETPAQLEAARAALERAERCGDKRLLVESLQGVANARALLGEPPDETLMERALELEAELGGLPGRHSPRVWQAMQLVWRSRDREARPLLAAAVERDLEEGQLTEYLHNLVALLWTEARLGELAGVERQAVEALELARDVGVGYLEEHLTALLGYLHALQGLERAREELLPVLERAEAARNRQVLSIVAMAMGVLELSQEHAGEALEWFERSVDPLGASKARPGRAPGSSGAIETLVLLDRLDEARGRLRRYEAAAVGTGAPGMAASSARCRGLLAAAEGDFGAADAALRRAVALHEETGFRFDLARTRLLHGTVLRRAKRRADAREELLRAAGLFDELGCRAWAARARAELARAGGRRSAGDGGLTPTEQRVAELVASGQSNREVAAQLFVSVRTVEANLSSIYRKLRVGSRVELARRLAAANGSRRP
jgi:DNA-binding CsgD family transcriptional regulator